MFRLAAQVFEFLGETCSRDQVHILGKHGKEAPHEEPGDDFGPMALTLKAFAEFREMCGNLSGHFGELQGRVEAEGTGPDGAQKGAFIVVEQIIKRDAVAIAIGELRVALPLAGEVSIDFDHAASTSTIRRKRGQPSSFATARA